MDNHSTRLSNSSHLASTRPMPSSPANLHTPRTSSSYRASVNSTSLASTTPSISTCRDYWRPSGT